MFSSTRSTKRFGALRVAAVGLALGAVAVACVPDPAPGSTTTTTEAPASNVIEIDDASLAWSYSQYAQYGVFGAWSMVATGANVSVTTVDGQVITGLPSEAGRPYKVANFSGGEGELDAETGAGTITWEDTGDIVLNAYPTLPAIGAPDETLRNPILTIEADGSGTLSFDAYLPEALDMNGNPVAAVGPERIDVVDFDDVSELTATSLTAVPTFAGREYNAPGLAPWNDCGGAGGSWPSSWINFLPDSVKAHYYSTGCGGLNDRKPGAPFTVSWN